MEWVPARVPGAVQLDWARAKAIPDFRYGGNVVLWSGLDEWHWTYRAVVEDWVELSEGESLFLILEGVDYACEVFLDGFLLARREGMQKSLEIPLENIDVGNSSELRIHILPAPKSKSEPKGRKQANQSCKPAVAYGWDFHPRLIPLGLWKDVYFEARACCHFSISPEIDYALNEDLGGLSGCLRVHLTEIVEPGMEIDWMLRRPDQSVFHSITVPVDQSFVEVPFSMDLNEDDLWWPHDQGYPTLFESHVELKSRDGQVLDASDWMIGFRRIRLVMAENEWQYPEAFPKSRSRPPMTLEVNGRRLFAKGSNWVCPDVFPSEVTVDRYARLLEEVRQANMNFIRVWGGSAAPPNAFYELCDEKGIMLWQEFPLACNTYTGSSEYLRVLDQESIALIERLRRHPSLVLWCGGNELFNAWSGMTDQALALRLLNRNTFDADPTRPFLPTAPIEGMGHGHYLFCDTETGEEAWSMFQRSDCSAYSEFGCPAPPSVEALRQFIPESELWPPERGTSWETHHAFFSWQEDSWLHIDVIDRYFGPSSSLDELVERGQLLQALGFQGLFEEARRQKPRSSMALNWCFTEPWPCAANNSLIAWPEEPKPALKCVAAACRPILASARLRKLRWSEGELFDPELWLLNDSPDAREAVQVNAILLVEGNRRLLASWQSESLRPSENQQGPRVQCRLPELPSARFEFVLEVDGFAEWNSSYTLLKALPQSKGSDFKPSLNF